MNRPRLMFRRYGPLCVLRWHLPHGHGLVVQVWGREVINRTWPAPAGKSI